MEWIMNTSAMRIEHTMGLEWFEPHETDISQQAR